jgi:hypothetical protein
LTVIHAPAVALAGKSILGEEVWLNVPFLCPIGWQWPNGPLYPFLFYNVPMLVPRSLTHPPGALRRLCWMDVSAVYTAFCFSDDEASQFRTLEERYRFLSDDERVCSFLACAKFIQGADPVMHAPIFGEPILTVIYAPAVALAGKRISGEEVWPGVDFLSPIGWRCPDGLLYPFLFSIY